MELSEIINNSGKYFLFGLAISIAVNTVTDDILPFDKLLMIAIVSSLIYSITEYLEDN